MTTEDLKIDVATLSSWLEKKIPVTVLDVRPKTEREEWSIRGSIHADVYDRLKVRTSRIPPTPPNYLTIASLNKQGSYDGYVPADLEAGANRCAIA